MITLGRRPFSHFLAPAIWVTVTLAVGAALWSPTDTDLGLSPFSLTVSDFAALDRGGPIETTMALLGIVSLLLLAVARARHVPVRGLPSVLLAVWGLGLVVAAVVPTDPLTTQLSGSAYVHRYASIAAFAALPAVGLLLSRRFATTPHAARTARWLCILSWTALAGAALMAYSAGPGGRELIGLVERLLLGCEVAMLGVLGRHLQQSTPDPAQHLRGHTRRMTTRPSPAAGRAFVTAGASRVPAPEGGVRAVCRPGSGFADRDWSGTGSRIGAQRGWAGADRVRGSRLAISPVTGVVRAQQNEELNGQSPVDRGKAGSKVHALSDANALPLLIGLPAANTHYSQALKPMVARTAVTKTPYRVGVQGGHSRRTGSQLPAYHPGQSNLPP